MERSLTERMRIRRSYGRISAAVNMPNLIEVQRNSYELFLQRETKANKRTKSGLQGSFQSVFPVTDYTETAMLEFVKYEFEDPKYDQEECQQRGATWSAPLRATLRLTVWDTDEDTAVRSIRDIKEQEVFIGDMPLMTENGTFIINGTERVIVSQTHRSPGVFFDHDDGRSHASGKYLFAARIIPYRGSWLDFEFDPKDIMQVRIDRRRKLPLTTMLMALDSEETAAKREKAAKKGEILEPSEAEGMSSQEILTYFYATQKVTAIRKGWKVPFDIDKAQGTTAYHDLLDPKTGEIVVKAGRRITTRLIKQLKEDKFTHYLLSHEEMAGRYLAADHINPETGEVLAEAGAEIDENIMVAIREAKLKSIEILDIDGHTRGPWIRNTLMADRNTNREEALIDIYRVMRPGEPPTVEAAEALFNGLFFDLNRYDLSAVGRVKMNARLGFETDDSIGILRREDILRTVQILHDLKDGKGEVDDIDHLGNRRIRSVGELMENQVRIGLLRMERAIRERMGTVDIDTAMPHDLINARPVAGAIREFFGSSQLSQFMDQTNPLSEVTHKRRLSALGPGGLTRERAGFEVRDVHTTHYGRICPIETPEGPNIGLINSLATYARINKYGFIETPYRRVKEGKLTDDVEYMSAIEEGKYIIAQANSELSAKGELIEELVNCRQAGEHVLVPPSEVDLIDVSPKQVVSVAASLIPFLENDDANRALMGSNMQRQAVPLLRPEAPLVGTGMEATVASDSGAAVTAQRDGIVDQVDATRIVVRAIDQKTGRTAGVDTYNLRKYTRSNQNTCINQKPLVKEGQLLKAGDIIADGPSTDLGELALGKNVLVAFMPWNGYNFEDSILISERIVRDDVFTSIHIEEFEVMARDTKLGQEEITRDIPNVGEEALRNLDEAGIVYVGAEVKAGDILVGKVTPKGESPVTPEEKLLRAIFGEKASDVRDTSLRLPPGEEGTVVDVQVFNRRGVEKDERALAIERHEIEALARNRDDERTILERSFTTRLHELLLDQKVVSGPSGLKKGSTITSDIFSDYTAAQLAKINVEDEKIMRAVEDLRGEFEEAVASLQKRFEDKVDKLQRGDELLPGVMKMVKVFIAIKRKLQPGDKMAGRHGNKGVISRILPQEDMPFLEDGTPVDICLNPLGVPSRMNVGQILETHLGWAGSNLGQQVGKVLDEVHQGEKSIEELRETLNWAYQDKGIKKDIKNLENIDVLELADNLRGGVPIATPVFDGANESHINEALERAGLPTSGQVHLIDGRTGEYFARPTTVGYIYMLKLHHLVDEKIHARSTGPYSLVTQQPLGGKAQFGGQRFGEMEVWALEAYGAAYTLQEMLTVKSDDQAGRTKVYEAIVRGEDNFEAGIPESFNVLVKELHALTLDVDLSYGKY